MGNKVFFYTAENKIPKSGSGLVLIGDAGRAVLNENDPAAFKAVIEDQFLHNVIVFVGVNAQLRGNALAKIKGSLENAPGFSVGADSVDGAVGMIVFPCAVLNGKISGVFSENKGKNAVYAVFLADIALPFGNVLFN